MDRQRDLELILSSSTPIVVIETRDESRIAGRSAATQNLETVILGNALDYPVRARRCSAAHRDVYKLVHQCARAVFAQKGAVGVHK